MTLREIGRLKKGRDFIRCSYRRYAFVRVEKIKGTHYIICDDVFSVRSRLLVTGCMKEETKKEVQLWPTNLII
jgi:hypothetical protein